MFLPRDPVTVKSMDLFSVDYQTDWSLCHCVSEDLAMGKGIAVLFESKFGGKSELRSQCPKTGGVCALKAFEKTSIYYLITKQNYWDKPTYESLESSLKRMRDQMIERGEKKIAMPKIGCGLDGLSWDKVKILVTRTFVNTGIDVLVCFK
jgi:hypothetical protein